MGVLTEIAYKFDRVAYARATGFEPEPWQQRVLHSESPRILLNCARQSGKSSTVALIGAHTALYVPNSTTLIVSYALRQSVELFRKVTSRGAMRKYMPVEVVAETQTSFEFDNGSRVVALPGTEASIRSFSNVHTLLFDEASHVPDETYEAARPVVAATGGGRIIALSTPFGTRGWWWSAWRDTSKDAEQWERYEVTAAEAPHISAKFLAQEKRRMGAWWFDQEYRCIFRDAQDSVFRQEDIDRMFAEDYETWDLEAAS